MAAELQNKTVCLTLVAAFRLSGPCSILQQKIFTFGVAYKYKAPLPGKVGHKSGKVVGKAWVIPACHLLCFSTESDISSEHPPNTEHCERSHCYTGGKEKLSHILLCMGDVAVFE